MVRSACVTQPAPRSSPTSTPAASVSLSGLVIVASLCAPTMPEKYCSHARRNLERSYFSVPCAFTSRAPITVSFITAVSSPLWFSAALNRDLILRKRGVTASAIIGASRSVGSANLHERENRMNMYTTMSNPFRSTPVSAWLTTVLVCSASASILDSSCPLRVRSKYPRPNPNSRSYILTLRSFATPSSI